ncbi:MAG: cation:proton antiporter [Candidatus Micrarchaeota archaeon]
MVVVESIPIIQIGVIVLSSLVFGILFSRLGFSSAVGYIIAGLLLGPLGFNYLSAEGVGIGVATVFGELGVIMLLFYLGLELNIRRFKETGAIATILAFVEMVGAFFVGFLVAKYFGLPDLEAIIIGGMITATSTVITSKFIIEKKLIDTTESRIVISILILEDFLAIVILVFITSIAEQKSLNLLVLNAVFFVIAMFFIVSRVSKHVLNLLSSIGYEDQMWMYAIGVFITVAYLGGYLGLSPALGAYFAGFALAESSYGERIKRELGLFREFFVLFFFVSFGATATLPAETTTYYILAALVGGYILSKLLAEIVVGTAIGMDLKAAVTGGLLMGSVGEFGLIIAAAAAPILANGAEIKNLAFLLMIVTTISMPILFSKKEAITEFFEKIYPLRLRKAASLQMQIQALDNLGKDSAFHNEYLVAMGNLFKNLVIAISIIYISYLSNFQINLPFAPFIPSSISVSFIILPLIIWPMYKFMTELKFLTKRVANTLLSGAFPTKNANIMVIERDVGDVFSGVVLVLVGIGTTIYMYSQYPSEYLFLLIPATYTIIAIMYLSRSFYSLIEQYEIIEGGLGEAASEIKDSAMAQLSREFNEHTKIFQQLQVARLDAKEKIQDAIRSENISVAKQTLSRFKKFESHALINILDTGTLKVHPRLREILESDIKKSSEAGRMGKIDTKDAFVKYMQEHLKPQLYEMELKKRMVAQGKGKKLKGK